MFHLMLQVLLSGKIIMHALDKREIDTEFNF